MVSKVEADVIRDRSSGLTALASNYVVSVHSGYDVVMSRFSEQSKSSWAKWPL